MGEGPVFRKVQDQGDEFRRERKNGSNESDVFWGGMKLRIFGVVVHYKRTTVMSKHLAGAAKAEEYAYGIR